MNKLSLVALAVTFVGWGCVSQGEYDSVTAERDSLVAEVLESASMINEINAELAQISDTSTALELPTEENLSEAARENEVTLAKIRQAIARLNEQEQAIEQNRERIAQLSSTNSRLQARIRAYQQTINELRAAAEAQEAQYQAIIDEQRATIATLASRLDTATAANDSLTEVTTELSATVALLENENNTVFYAAGTRDELRDRGLIVSEGKKFLIFGGKTWQPARDLNPEDFVALNKLEDTSIPLPRPDKAYRILTRQNPAFLASAGDDGKVRDSLVIAAPAEFWSPSRFLILVQQ